MYPNEIPPPPLPNFPDCNICARPVISLHSPSPWLLQEGPFPQIKQPQCRRAHRYSWAVAGALPSPTAAFPLRRTAGDTCHSAVLPRL